MTPMEYKKYGECTRIFNFGFGEKYTPPKRISRKVETVVGWLIANGKIGTTIELSVFFGRVFKKWDNKSTFGTKDMLSPSDLKAALRLYYAKVTAGDIQFTDGEKRMAEVIENKRDKKLLLVVRKYVPELLEIQSPYENEVEAPMLEVAEPEEKTIAPSDRKSGLEEISTAELISELEKRGYKCLPTVGELVKH